MTPTIGRVQDLAATKSNVNNVSKQCKVRLHGEYGHK